MPFTAQLMKRIDGQLSYQVELLTNFNMLLSLGRRETRNIQIHVCTIDSESKLDVSRVNTYLIKHYRIFSQFHILQNMNKHITVLWLSGHEDVGQSTAADIQAK